MLSDGSRDGTAGGERILLVDDNATNLQVLHHTLDKRGYRLFVARDGEAAIRVVEREQPDLILLDIMMPEMDGYEVCRRCTSW